MIDTQTLIVAVLSGIGGGPAGPWLQTPHERHEAFRERQINATDDFTTGLRQALIALDDAYSACLNHGFLDPQQQFLLRNPATGEIEDT